MSGFKNTDNDRLKHHHSLFKLKTPPWKEIFREKCFQRLKSSRGQLVDKFRGLGLCTNEALDVLMAEDWNSIRKEKNQLPSLLSNDVGGELNDLEINEFLSIMDEIQKELLEEERKLLEEYNAASEDSLTSAVDYLEKDEVICPICKSISCFNIDAQDAETILQDVEETIFVDRNPMHQNHSIIFCACGVRIDVQQDGLTLQHMKTELFKGLETHEQICCATPSFSLIHFTDTTNLTITCGVCNFMYFVI